MFLGRVAPIDISDVTGMNLWDIHKFEWHDKLMSLTAGGDDKVAELRRKLGDTQEDGGKAFGNISQYFVKRYGFSPEAKIIPFTGDNPSTILALPLRPSDAMVSLGTSTTFLMSTPKYIPDPAYHFMNHPTTFGHFMFMLCYKNGGLAREQVRDTLNRSASDKKGWDAFNEKALEVPPLSQRDDRDMRLGLYFPRPEIVPNVRAGQWRYSYNPKSGDLQELSDDFTPDDARNIIESQMLSLRLRSHNLVPPEKDPKTGEDLPAQPGRVYLVGGGSANPAIAKICGEVLGSIDGVYKLDIGGNACALGSAYKAVWGCERKKDQTFEDLIGSRWDEDKFVMRVADGYKVSGRGSRCCRGFDSRPRQKGLFEQYGDSVKGFDKMEKLVIERDGQETVQQKHEAGGMTEETEKEGSSAVRS